MDFEPVELDEETSKLWHDVRNFLDEHVTEAVHEQEWRTGDGLNLELNEALGIKGWLTPSWPPEEGGIGASPVQRAIIAREFDAHRVPSLTQRSSMLVEGPIRRFFPPDLRNELLAGLARGSVLIALGYTEPETGSDLANVATRAIRDGDEWVVNGEKMFTSAAHNCQYIFLATRTNMEVPKHKGITMFLAPLHLNGIEIKPIQTLGGERANSVIFDNVRVDDRFRLGPVDGGWAVLNDPSGALNLEHEGVVGRSIQIDERPPSASFLFVLRAALDVAIRWAQGRNTHGHRPIDDPLVREILAQVLIDVESGENAEPMLSKVFTSDALVKNTALLMDLIGSEVLVAHNGDDALGEGWIEYAHRFAQGTSLSGGTIDVFRNMLAEQRLGLPRGRPSSSNR